MTTTLNTQTRKNPQRSPSRWLAVGGVLWIVAFAVRAWNMTTANELFIDELTYSRLSIAASNGELPHLSGTSFFLHPPFDFYLNGLIIDLGNLSGSEMDLAYELRWANVVLGACVTLLVFLLLKRLVGPRWALVGAVIVAFDPFVLRNDGRVMLETPTVVLLLTGWLLLLIASDTRIPRKALWLTIGGATAFGLAVLTKDIAALFTVVPVILACWWRQTMTKRTAIRITAVAASPYVTYLLILLANGQIAQWWSAKLAGFSRMVGSRQISGFNSPDAPSFTDRLVEQVPRFGTSYVLIALCVVAGAAAGLSSQRDRRMVGIVAVVAGTMGIYAALFGAFEEQFGYYVVIASVLACAAAGADLMARRPRAHRPLAVVTALFVAATLTLGFQTRLVSDDGYLQARAWLNSHISSGSRVALTGPTAEFALRSRPGYGVWPSLASLYENRAEYVLTQERQLREGYGYAAPQLLDWLQSNATPIFRVHGPSSGDTVVWKIDLETLERAVKAGTTIAPVTGSYR